MLAPVLASCGGGSPAKSEAHGARGPEACQFELAPRSSSLTRLPPVDPPAPGASRFVVQAEAPFARIRNELEAKVPPRLAEVRGESLGIAGTLNYTVDRGPFTLSVENDTLIVRTDARAHAEACSRGRCYASCDPIALVRAEVPLELLPDYRFSPSRVTAKFTRGCKIRALSGFLTIDVTPNIEDEIQPMLRRVQGDIDRQLPNLKPEAERLWAEMSKARSMPLVGCVVLQPAGIVQGPSQGTADALGMRFALLAAPELRSTCGQVAPAAPLPPLTQEPSLPAEDEVTLGLVSSLNDVASAFETAFPVGVGKAHVRIGHALVSSAGSAIDADLSLQGDACGEITLRATPRWSDDGHALELTSPTLAPGETERVRDASLEPKPLASALARAPRVGVLLDPDRIAAMLPAFASSLSDETIDVRVTIASVRRTGATARDEDLVAWVAMRGGVLLKQK